MCYIWGEWSIYNNLVFELFNISLKYELFQKIFIQMQAIVWSYEIAHQYIWSWCDTLDYFSYKWHSYYQKAIELQIV